MPRERVLITGATGLLGTPLSASLENRGFPVITLSRGPASDATIDLCQTDAVFDFLNRITPGAIVNLVALTNVDRCEENRQSAYLQNVRTVEVLIEWIQAHPSTRFIHISTDQVYDSEGLKKEHEITLRNVYAITKYCSEVVASKAGATILRTNFFGRSLVQGRISLSDWVIDNLRNGTPINLFSDIFFSPLSLSTLVKMIEKVLESPLPGVYNLGSHGGMSKCDFALRIAETFGLSTSKTRIVDSTAFTFNAPRPKDMRMDSELFERTFSVALPSLDDEIASLRNEYGLST